MGFKVALISANQAVQSASSKRCSAELTSERQMAPRKKTLSRYEQVYFVMLRCRICDSFWKFFVKV